MTQPSATEAARRARRNIRLGSLGAALEYYDFVVYLYVATLIGQAFFPADLSPTMRLVQTLAIYSTGLLIRPVAGILIARVADRVGRKQLFMLTVVVMAVATLGIGLLPTYEQVGWPAPVLLLLLRVAQGCAVGGEIPAAAVFVTEHARPDGVARAGAFQQMTAYSGFLFGAGAAFVAGLVATHLTPDTPSLAWRLPFLVGGVLGVVAIYLRRRIDETPAFVNETVEQDNRPAAPVREVLLRHRPAVLFAVLVAVALTLVNVTYFNFWPTYLQTSLGLSSTSALLASLVAIAAAMAAMPAWGYLADRYGWSRMLRWASLATAVTAVLLLLVLPTLPPDSALAIWIPLPAAMAAAGIPAAAPGMISSIFPTEVRQTGFSLPYNVVIAVLGGFLNLILVWLVATVGLGAPMYTVLVACVLVLVASVAVLRIRTYLGRGAQPAARSRPRPRAARDSRHEVGDLRGGGRRPHRRARRGVRPRACRGDDSGVPSNGRRAGRSGCGRLARARRDPRPGRRPVARPAPAAAVRPGRAVLPGSPPRVLPGARPGHRAARGVVAEARLLLRQRRCGRRPVRRRAGLAGIVDVRPRAGGWGGDRARRT
ncbi:hypothetical protein GCM10010472_70970 [Pseudonocardia halophobica]|uniref:Major facilitator superfamily (MFS) profile domain-containing protein n=1 Tax=Pseudonocardia halophobica TaxID=29401 RepID=A0A9W6L538_9PSEU|nr:hypothetical protein GCM10017577_33870 [Pseudonocardia halophobica]